MTLPDFGEFSVYLYVQRRLKRDNVYKSRYNLVRGWFGDKPFDLKTALQFLSHLETERKSAPETLNHYRDLLMKIEDFLDLPHEKRFMHRTAPYRKRRKIPKVIHEDQFMKILQTHPKRSRSQAEVDLRMDSALIFIYTTGVRNGEACGLKWDDVQPDRVIVRRASPFEEETKNKEDRSLPITGYLYERLMKLPRYPHGFVFGSRQGPMYRETLNKELKERLKVLGMEGTIDRIHELRHSCGTILAENGIPVEKIKEYLGHKEISSTMIYIHMNIDQLRECSERAPLNQGYMSLATAQKILERTRKAFEKSPFTVSLVEVMKGWFRIDVIDSRIVSQSPELLRTPSAVPQDK